MHHSLHLYTTSYLLSANINTPRIYQHPWYSQLPLLENTTTCASQLQQKQKSEPTGQKFIDLLHSIASGCNPQNHWKGSANQFIYDLPPATKGRINEEAYSAAFTVPIDRSFVGSHRGDFPDKTQAKLSCIKADGNFIINHLSPSDDWFLLTLIEPYRTTLIKVSNRELWKLNPSKQNGHGDYMLSTTRDALLNLNIELLADKTF